MGAEQKALVLNRDDLPFDGNTWSFEGKLYRSTDVSFITVDMRPEEEVKLHKHPYGEIFIVLEGKARYTVGKETLEAQAGQIVVAPPDVPHGFANSGDTQLRQIDIHLSDHFITEWLES